MTKHTDPTGVLVVNKPAGITSHDVVNRIRRLFATKRVGHTGTLDPLATGVLVICLGQATRVAEYLSAERKEYRATAVFGISTDTEDATGVEYARVDASHISRQDVDQVLPQFRGDILQTPPMVSAIHYQGKRLYELARAGVEVERDARAIHIYKLALTDFRPGALPEADFLVECSTGTYIRTLCSDIGSTLAVGAMMSTLQRTRVGQFTLEQAHTLDELTERAQMQDLGSTLRPLADALAHWPSVILDSDAMERLSHGQTVPGNAPDGACILLLDADQNAVGLARPSVLNELAPYKVFI